MPDGAFCRSNAQDAVDVRLALPGDEAALFDLLLELHRDNAGGVSIPKSDEKVRKAVADACNGRGGIAGVIGPYGGRLHASIGIFCACTWYSDWWDILSVHWLFQRAEERRGTAVYDALCDFAERHWADMEKRLGRSLLVEMSFVSARRLDARERLWGRRGRKIGTTFLLNRTLAA